MKMTDNAQTQARTRAGLDPFERAVIRALVLRQELEDDFAAEGEELDPYDPACLLFWRDVAERDGEAVSQEAFTRWTLRHVHNWVRRTVEKARLEAHLPAAWREEE